VLRGEAEGRAAILDERSFATRRNQDADPAGGATGDAGDVRRDAIRANRPEG
jgi:hypothetical protein